MSAHRSTDSAEYYYLYNKSEDESVATDVAFEGRHHPADQANPRSAGRPYRLDPWSGSIEPIARYDYNDDRIVLDVELAPQETVIVAIGNDKWHDDVETVGVHATETDGDDVVPGNGQLEFRASSAGTYSTTLSNGKTVETKIGSVPDPQRLDSWDLRVESWEPTEAALDADGGVAATETKTVPMTSNSTVFDRGQKSTNCRTSPASSPTKPPLISGERGATNTVPCLTSAMSSTPSACGVNDEEVPTPD